MLINIHKSLNNIKICDFKNKVRHLPKIVIEIVDIHVIPKVMFVVTPQTYSNVNYI